MSRALVLVASVAVLIAAAIALAPASLVNPAIERASLGNVRLAEAEGTLWNGRGVLAVAGAAHIPIAWRLEFWPLLRGKAEVAFVAPSPTASAPRAQVVAQSGALDVRALDAALPAELVAALATRAGVKLSGGARFEWADAQFAVANEAALRLGSVRANLAAAGDRLTGPVTNEGGDFDLRGALSLSTTGTPEATLTATPRTGEAAQTRSLIVTARPDHNGWNVDYRVGPR